MASVLRRSLLKRSVTARPSDDTAAVSFLFASSRPAGCSGVGRRLLANRSGWPSIRISRSCAACGHDPREFALIAFGGAGRVPMSIRPPLRAAAPQAPFGGWRQDRSSGHCAGPGDPRSGSEFPSLCARHDAGVLRFMATRNFGRKSSKQRVRASCPRSSPPHSPGRTGRNLGPGHSKRPPSLMVAPSR